MEFGHRVAGGKSFRGTEVPRTSVLGPIIHKYCLEAAAEALGRQRARWLAPAMQRLKLLPGLGLRSRMALPAYRNRILAAFSVGVRIGSDHRVLERLPMFWRQLV